MAMLFSGSKENENLANACKPNKVDFAYFVQKISDILGSVELRAFKTSHTLSHEYQTAEVLVAGEVVGELFRIHPNVEKDYDLDVTFVCEIDFSKIKDELIVAKKTSKYQASFRDLSVIMPLDMSYEKVKDVIQKSEVANLIRFYPVDKYSDEALGKKMSLSIRFCTSVT